MSRRTCDGTCRRLAGWLGALCLVAAAGVSTAAAATAAPTPNPYAQVAGQPVVDVQIRVPAPHKIAELRPLIDVPLGQGLEPAAVQAALGRLFALDKFAAVEVFLLPPTPPAQGIGLLFVLTPKARLHRLQLEGRLGVDKDALRAALRLFAGDEVDGRTASTLHRRARAALRRSGFPKARITVRTQAMQLSGDVDLGLQIDAGPPQRLAALGFVGQPRLPGAVLRDLVQSRVGAPVDLEELEADRQRLLAAYRAHDFLQAEVGAVRLHPLPNGDQRAEFSIVAHDRFAFSFVGLKAFTPAALRALIPQDSLLPLAAQLQLWQQAIGAAYANRGYQSARIRLAQVRLARGERTVVVRVDEGVPWRVQAIHFSGNTVLPSVVLEQQCRALLRRELGDDGAFAALRPFDQAHGSPQIYRRMAPPSAPSLDPEDRYVPELYRQAAEQIAAAYRDLGYLQVRIGSPSCRPVDDSPGGLRTEPAEVDIEVHEGPQTHLFSLEFAGNQAVAAGTLFEEVQKATEARDFSAPVRPGLPLSMGGLEDARIAIVRHYRNNGFLYAQVDVEVLPRPDGHSADVRFNLREGPQVHVARTLLRGNQYTRDGVIRSRISLQPGDVYKLDQAIGDQRRIGELGVFNAVRVRLIDEEHAAPQKDVVAEVHERRRQPIEVAPGISTAEGPRLRLGYAHLNVFGTATTFSASLKFNRQIFFGLFGDYADTLDRRYASYHGTAQLTRAVEREGRVGLRSPPIRLLPFDPILRLDLVDLRVNAVRYSLNSETLVLGADMRLPGRFKSTLETQLGLVDLECDPNIEPNCNLTPEVRHLEGRPIDVGNLWILSGGPLLIWDRRDNPLNPHQGVFASLRTTLARGGTAPFSDGPREPFSFIKYEAKLTAYIRLAEATLAMSARGGLISLWRSDVPIDQRFFMGGRDSLRGFVEATLIPQDACVGLGPLPKGCAEQLAPSPSGPPLSRGGNSMALLKTELRLPLSDALAASLFIDVGNLWIDVRRARPFAVRMGVGAGLRYATPVGAMAFDLGVNPMPRAAYGEPWTQFHFSLGTF